MSHQSTKSPTLNPPEPDFDYRTAVDVAQDYFNELYNADDAASDIRLEAMTSHSRTWTVLFSFLTKKDDQARTRRRIRFILSNDGASATLLEFSAICYVDITPPWPLSCKSCREQ